MFKLPARLTYRFRWVWIGVGLLTIAVGAVYGVNVFAGLKGGGLSDPSSGSAREERQLLKLFPRSRVSIILLASSAIWTVDQPQFRDDFLRTVSRIDQDSSKPVVTSYYSTNDATFVSRNRQETFALIGVAGDQDAAYLRIRRSLAGSGLDMRLGGPAAADYEVNTEVQKDLPKLGAISLPILALLLILIFRSLIAAALPLFIGAISVLGAFSLTRLLSSVTDISVFAANIISLLGLGLAIDYSLLYVSRFRDELAIGNSVEAAVAVSTRTAGEAILLSGTTVALSLLGLLAFPEMFLRSMGIGGALAVVVAMAASLTVLPATLCVLGANVDRLGLPLRYMKGNHNWKREWRILGEFVVRRPASVMAITLGILLVAGEPFLHVRFADPGVDSLPAGFQSRIVSDTITRDFAARQNPPIEILATMKDSPVSPTEIARLMQYTDRLSKLPDVSDVRGLTSLSSDVPRNDYAIMYGYGGNPQVHQIESRYLSANSTLITVDYAGSSEDDQARSLLRTIRAIPPPDGSVLLVGGDTADLVDRLHSLIANLPIAVAAVFITTFVVMLLMLSSLAIPLKAILLNTLSLSAAFGLMTWVFQYGHFHDLLRFTPSESLDPTLPVLIFAIAFGLATDYEVFLVSRIKEEYERSGNNTEAVVIGVEKTGGIITSAGLLLVVVVAAFGMSDILPMKEMGVGLAVAVVVDAVIVRALLVPAAMQVFGRMNWWLPWKKKKEGS